MAGLLDFLQSASNSVASNVTAPVDGIAWLLRKAGIPVPDAPVGGSDWAQNAGLTRPVQQSASSLAGESLGMIAPMLIAAKAPQVARGLLQAGENAMVPPMLSKQAGVLYHGGELVKNPTAYKQGVIVDGQAGISFTPNIVEASRYARHNIGPINAIDDSALKIYKGGDDLIDSAVKAGDFSAIKSAGFDGVKLGGLNETVLFDPEKVLSLPRKVAEQNINRSATSPRYFNDFKEVQKPFTYPQDKALATAQRNAALPIEQGGLGLGAENTAMERARALGFDTDFYHGQTGMSLSNKGEMVELTPNAGKAEGGALFGSGPNLASRYAKDRDWLGQGGAVYPLKARSDHLLKDGYPMPELADINKMSSKEVDSLVNDIDNWNNKIDKPSLFESGLHDANKANADGVVFRQVVDAPTWVDARREFPQDIYGLQKGARSRFAAFDPMRRNEADLLGRADPELLGLLSAGLLGYGGYNALSKP